ncbi:Xaa-Pro peptidase family protein [Aureimonas altamirensis]|uniref:M24 family metallopeptidase n=1 Tax=Aureimonas altamirensis TaxID=370622 RepID=UPI001E4E2B51|nr:Xaa-Pro peptidase family protein [Aureimonas altamirensis]UHD46367.1 Xaa-Pro peptidase family protein [Aureimonas altamirensis]
MLHDPVRLRSALAHHGISAVVATSPENVLYTGGFWSLPQWVRRGPQAFVVYGAGPEEPDPTIIAGTSTLDLVADQGVKGKIRRFGSFAVEASPLGHIDLVSERQADLHGLADDESPVSALIAEITQRGLISTTIGLDEGGLLPGDIERLRKELPGTTFVPAASILRQVRAVKTEEEVKRLRTIAGITERSVDAALAAAELGATELDLARAFHLQTVRENAFPVLGCIGFGERSALMNVQPSDRALRRGDIIRFDVGGHYGQYRADIARIASVGPPSPEIAAMYSALHKGVQRGIELIRPGVSARDVFHGVVQTVQAEGIPHYQRNHVGHGIGLDGYGAPLLSPGSQDILEAGMVLCIETPYYELGRVGLQVEDMLVVRPDGAELLTNCLDTIRVVD